VQFERRTVASIRETRCATSDPTPAKLPNKAEGPAAEAMEGRGLAKGNSPERNVLRTQSREGALSALERVRQAAKNNKKRYPSALFLAKFCSS
jgi:hypothetical protein